MSLAIRVIPCLDVSDGRVVKGVNFTRLRDAGDPVELARAYDSAGADEITFLDISASLRGHEAMMDVIEETAGEVFVPLTVGGGVRSVDDVAARLRRGADKIGLNTAAIERPQLISDIAERFGRQVIVLSVDARRATSQPTPSGWEVTTHGGTRATGIDALEWTTQAVERGAGEVLLNSMDSDGVKTGFDLALIEAVRNAVDVPLIASGGAGEPSHFVDAARAGADAVLAASVFHFGELTIGEVKEALAAAGFAVRDEGRSRG